MPNSEHLCNNAISKKVQIDWPRLKEEDKYSYLQDSIETIIEDGCGQCFEDIIKTIVGTYILDDQLTTVQWLIHILKEPEHLSGDAEIVELCQDLSDNPGWDRVDPILWLKQKEKELLLPSPSISIVKKKTNIGTEVETTPEETESINFSKDKKPVPLIDVRPNFPIEVLHTGLNKILISNIDVNAFSKHFRLGLGNYDRRPDELTQINWLADDTLLAYFIEEMKKSSLTEKTYKQPWATFSKHFFQQGREFKRLRGLPTEYRKNKNGLPKEAHIIDNIIADINKAFGK